MAISQAERLKQVTQILGFKPPIDGVVSAIWGQVVLDIVATDAAMSEHDPDYNYSKGLYKGRRASMQQYLQRKYTEAEYLFICDLLLVTP